MHATGVQWRAALWEDLACLAVGALIVTRSAMQPSARASSTTSTRTQPAVSLLSQQLLYWRPEVDLGSAERAPCPSFSDVAAITVQNHSAIFAFYAKKHEI